MPSAAEKLMTLDEFLAWEREQPDRHEFTDGVIRMMTGGSLAHVTITMNVGFALRQSLRGTGCRPLVNDASADRTYEYGAAGNSIENYTLNSGNTAPRGAATGNRATTTPRGAAAGNRATAARCSSTASTSRRSCACKQRGRSSQGSRTAACRGTAALQARTAGRRRWRRPSRARGSASRRRRSGCRRGRTPPR